MSKACKIAAKAEFKYRLLQNKMTARVFGPSVKWDKKLALKREK